MDTIFALSSGAPPAGLAIVRISGPDAFVTLSAMAGPVPEPRMLTLRAIYDPLDCRLLDRALVVAFPAGSSVTGEDLVEFHLHGGRAVVAAVEQAIGQQSGLRRAAPGEFTRRALISGRIDLTEAEGLGDLLSAETEMQRRAALSVAEGAVRRQVDIWMHDLLRLSARVEAQLDFADEDDVPLEAMERLRFEAHTIAGAISLIVHQMPVERLRNGIAVVLAGPPNSGKSTLLNALVDRDAAIVSAIPGTTRDRIEIPIARNGVAYVLNDTAGLAAMTNDPIEAIGIKRAKAAMQGADILLWLGDTAPPLPGAIWVHARNDLIHREVPSADHDISVSASVGTNMAALWELIERRAKALLPSLDVVALNTRQRDHAKAAAQQVALAAAQSDILLLAEHLRAGRSELDHITGHGNVEAMLDQLFGTFCIGK